MSDMPRNDNHESDIQPQREYGAYIDCTNPVDSQTVSNSHDSEKSVPTAAPLFSVYTRRQKWFIISLAGFAGLFRLALSPVRIPRLLTCRPSPLTANIYFPAIQTLSNAFHTSVELINITVTVYMILQGIGKRSHRWYPTAIKSIVHQQRQCFGAHLQIGWDADPYSWPV